jgi:hypothetical protein
MLPPELFRAGLGIASFMVLTSGVMLPFLDRTSPEYFLTMFCLILGLGFGTVLLLLSRRRPK